MLSLQKEQILKNQANQVKKSNAELGILEEEQDGDEEDHVGPIGGI